MLHLEFSDRGPCASAILKGIAVFSVRPSVRALGRISAILAALAVLGGCSDTHTTAEGDAPESVQRDALESTWDKASDDERRSQCAAYEADPIGAIADFEDNFDYDVVKEWLEAKC